jgi:hypothetical protein
MKTTSILLSLIAASALSFGCNKKKADDKKTEPETAGKTTGTEPTQPEQPAAAADAAPAASKEVPTEQDFEEKAASEVTKDNVEGEVEKMEKEIGAQGGPAGGAAAPAAGGDKAGGETGGQKK